MMIINNRKRQKAIQASASFYLLLATALKEKFFFSSVAHVALLWKNWFGRSRVVDGCAATTIRYRTAS